MLTGDLIWDDSSEDHIARHGITPDEVEEVCRHSHWLLRARGRSRVSVLGQTAAGRYITVILESKFNDEFYPITARDMNEAERTRYRRWSNRRGR